MTEICREQVKAHNRSSPCRILYQCDGASGIRQVKRSTPSSRKTSPQTNPPLAANAPLSFIPSLREYMRITTRTRTLTFIKSFSSNEYTCRSFFKVYQPSQSLLPTSPTICPTLETTTSFYRPYAPTPKSFSIPALWIDRFHT